MLSYQHAFHAGNHADILKHYVLTFVLNSLNKKDKPYTMFDTHSGSGLYDLFDNRIVKTGEAEKGIQGLLKVIGQEVGDSEKGDPEKGVAVKGGDEGDFPVAGVQEVVPEELKNYLTFVKQYTDKNLYPGSPEIERRFLRQQDTLILSELHPQEIVNLKENMETPVFDRKIFGGAGKVKVLNKSGWEMIKGSTPPVTKRGAVLIDPSYEETQDYIDAANVICEVNKKWSNGIIMLWYPLLAHREIEIEMMTGKIISSAKNINKNVEISNLQLKVYNKDNENLPRLYGSGMLVINSPWKLGDEGNIVIKYLENVLSPLF